MQIKILLNNFYFPFLSDKILLQEMYQLTRDQSCQNCEKENHPNNQLH